MKIKILVLFVLIIGIAVGTFLGYSLRISDYVVLHKSFPMYGFKYFEYAQIAGLRNKKVETAINESLANFFENIDIDYNLLQEWPPETLLQNEQCLSIKDTFWYTNNNERFITISLYQTFSLKTGKELQLGDILNINEDFVNYLMESPTAIKTVLSLPGEENNDERLRNAIKTELGAAGIMDYLQKANVPYSSENYYDKCTFFLLPGEINIVCVNSQSILFGIRLELSDIEPYLKIPVE